MQYKNSTCPVLQRSHDPFSSHHLTNHLFADDKTEAHWRDMYRPKSPRQLNAETGLEVRSKAF